MTAQGPQPVISDQWGRQFVEMVADLVCVCLDGEIAFINDSGARMLGGNEPRDLIGKQFIDYIHPDFAELASLGLDILAEDGESVPLMFQRPGDGKVIEVEIHARIMSVGCTGLSILIHARDITERSRSAEALLKSEDRYRRLVELALDFTCICSNGEISFINAAGIRMLGADKASDIVGRQLAEFIHADYHDIIGLGLESLAEESDPLPLKFVRLDGGVVDCETAVLPFSATGEPVFMVEARDISERKRSAEALQQREKRLQGIMDSVAEGIITADEHGVIQSFNPASERIFGWTTAEMIGRNLSSLMPQHHAVRHDHYLSHYCETGEAQILGRGRVMEGLRKDGGTFAMELNVTELREGRNRLFIGIVRDITLRKQQEEALRRARDELELRVEERTRELHRLSQQTAQIVNSASEGIIGLDRDGRMTFVNPTAASMTGWAVEELVGRTAQDILRHARAAGLAQGEITKTIPLRAALRRGLYKQQTELTFWRRDGSSFPVEFASAPIEENGRPMGAVIVFRDITQRKQAEEGLRLAATVFETTAEAIMVLDAGHRVTTVNPAYAEITGYHLADVAGCKPKFLEAGEQEPAFYEEMWNTVRLSGRWEGEQWNHRKNGDRYAERLAISVITDDRGQPTQYVVVFSDITQRKQDEERIRYQANYDALTGLPNRALFLDRLHHAVASARRSGQMVGLMFIDLDGFKLVNDTLGHDIGDKLLQEAARRLQSCVRTGDTVARLGGDEFTVIMPNLGDFNNAPIVAQRIIDTLEQPMLLSGHEAFVSGSIGITAFPNDANDDHTLLKNADAAMYRAKEMGKANFQFFTADMNEQVRERMVIKNGLSKALERDEFVLYYQPKIDLATGRITSVEALLRWLNPELGMVSPVKFIPVMEESGLIGAVGEWALEVACRQHKDWADQGFPDIRVAVNLSVRQLRQADLAKTVETILARTGITSAGLELEITESMIMKDTENAVAILRQLHDMGVHLAMDDFGTGYSSLSYLKRFPLDTIKIDRSFVNDIATDPDDLEIIRTIITMGHSLRRSIVAEGVETEEQKAILTELRCDEIQGYLISRPVPAADLTEMLRRERAAQAAT